MKAVISHEYPLTSPWLKLYLYDNSSSVNVTWNILIRLFDYLKCWQGTPGVFNILTSTCASRRNGVHFFDISTSKSAPTLVCFVHFDLQMCFAPQRRALFHLSSGQPAALASLLFDLPEPQIIRKTQCFATFPPFRASASSFFWLFL